jgi:hypothetical protein
MERERERVGKWRVDAATQHSIALIWQFVRKQAKIRVIP